MILKQNELLVHVCSNCGKASECLLFGYEQIGNVLKITENGNATIKHLSDHHQFFHKCEFCNKMSRMKIQKAKVFLVNE